MKDEPAPRVVDTPEAMRSLSEGWRRDGLVVGFVPTMGALHEGHAALLRAAARTADSLIATLFVNPLQFGPSEDFDRYPRTRERDLEIFAREQVDVVFAPTIEELYPGGPPNVRVDPGPLGAILEGASRPGFFPGVLTVVLKLLHQTRPGAAFFGEKDYQQLALIRAMVTDFDLDVEIVGVPTVREPDGLARSSRNAYLDPAQRQAAVALSRALYAGAAAGPYGAEAVRSAARAELTGVDLDYLALTDPGLGPTPAHGAARLLVAARVGRTRLIDNAAVVLSARPGA